MAVAAVDAEAADVVGVAELDRLGDVGVGAGDEVGAQQQQPHPCHQPGGQRAAHQAEARNLIGAAFEDLAHRSGSVRSRADTAVRDEAVPPDMAVPEP